MTLDSKAHEAMASAEPHSLNIRGQTFGEHMSVPSIDSVQDFLDAMSDHGLPADNLTFLEGDHADESMDMLADQLEGWASILRAKAKGFRVLREEGFAAIKAAADMVETVHHVVNGELLATGEWCRRDGIVYVTYRGMEATTIAMRDGLKSYLDRRDRENATSVLELLFDHRNNPGD